MLVITKKVRNTNKNNNVLYFFLIQIKLIYPEPGFVEIDPDHLWEIIVKVIKDTLKSKLLKCFSNRKISIKYLIVSQSF